MLKSFDKIKKWKFWSEKIDRRIKRKNFKIDLREWRVYRERLKIISWKKTRRKFYKRVENLNWELEWTD